MCVSCNCHMHLTPECTALSTAVINGIEELGVNVMLLCNKCVENNELDNFIRGRAPASISKKLSTFNVVDKLKNIREKIDRPSGSKSRRSHELTCEKVGRIYAAVVAVKKSTEIGNTNTSQKVNKGKTNHISQRLRIQGLPEDPSKDKG